MQVEGNEHTFSAGVIRLLSSDILLIEYKNDIIITDKHIQETRDLRKRIIGEVPYFPVIDMRKGFIKFSKEAKKWVAENRESSKIRIMDVFLVPNWGMKLEVQLYLKFFRPIVPTKVVTSLNAAFDVINQCKQEKDTFYTKVV